MEKSVLTPTTSEDNTLADTRRDNTIGLQARVNSK